MMLTNSAEHLALLNFLIYNKHFPPRIYSKTMDHPSLRLKSWDWNNIIPLHWKNNCYRSVNDKLNGRVCLVFCYAANRATNTNVKKAFYNDYFCLTFRCQILHQQKLQRQHQVQILNPKNYYVERQEASLPPAEGSCIWYWPWEEQVSWEMDQIGCWN